MKLFLFAIASAWAALDTLYRCLDRVTRGRPPEWLPVSIEQFLGIYSALVLLPLVRRASERHDWRTYAWTLPLFSITHTSLNWATRAVAFPLSGLGTYDYGAMPLRYLMEFPSDVLMFSLAAYIHRQYLAWERGQDMERQLTAARMALLTRQLQPHFLFNALNTISALMYEDVAKADRVLHRLGDFLRATIDLRDTTTIPLEEELRLLDDFLAVMRARMETQLDVRMETDAAAAVFPVPPLFLQPLLENAIQHGRNPDDGRVLVLVRICLEDDGMHGLVRDHGPGWADGQEGFGLEAVRQRLETLYAGRAALAAENAPDGGAMVRWVIPRC
jgi:two-component system, LytTR family, sensor kinase